MDKNVRTFFYRNCIKLTKCSMCHYIVNFCHVLYSNDYNVFSLSFESLIAAQNQSCIALVTFHQLIVYGYNFNHLYACKLDKCHSFSNACVTGKFKIVPSAQGHLKRCRGDLGKCLYRDPLCKDNLLTFA